MKRNTRFLDTRDGSLAGLVSRRFSTINSEKKGSRASTPPHHHRLVADPRRARIRGNTTGRARILTIPKTLYDEVNNADGHVGCCCSLSVSSPRCRRLGAVSTTVVVSRARVQVLSQGGDTINYYYYYYHRNTITMMSPPSVCTLLVVRRAVSYQWPRPATCLVL